MRQAGRYHSHYQQLKQKYTFEQLCREPDLACEVTLGPIQEFDFDAAILFSDILFPLDFLGMELSFSPGPVFEKNLTNSMLDNMHISAFEEYIQFQHQALQNIRSALPSNKSLIGFTGVPLHFIILLFAIILLQIIYLNKLFLFYRNLLKRILLFNFKMTSTY